MEPTVTIVLPPTSDDEISDGLRWLTGELGKRLPDADMGYGLGGENGYGVDYENDTFVMRRFWWGDCTCGADESDDPYAAHTQECAHMLPNFHHKPSGFKVRWYKWIGRDNEVEGSAGDLRQMFGECLSSLPSPPEPQP